jgi:hypothetical protein
MFTKHRVVLCVSFLAIGAMSAAAQSKQPAETRNAALRYWLAFGDLQDPPADQATMDLLQKTAAGDAPWDETKLGPILDKNEAAIWEMQRATKLPECDWGLEYSQGWRASIAYAPKARVLARLNTLYGMRLAARGDLGKATDSWLAGIRFSQHLSQGGSLIFLLIAKTALLSHLNALNLAARNASLPLAEKQRIETALRDLPETAYDWGGALRLEEAAIEMFADELARSPEPAKLYATVMGDEAAKTFSVPTAKDRAIFHQLMLSAENALRQPPDAAREKLTQLQAQVNSLSQFFQQTTPSFTKQNEARAEIAATRAKLLQALMAK